MSRLRIPVSGSCVVTAQRPTLPPGRTTASPIRTARRIQPSSTCAGTPSMTNDIRKRRESTGASSPAASAMAARAAAEMIDAEPPSSARSSPSFSPVIRTTVRRSPASSLSASAYGPRTSRDGRSCP